MVINNDGVIGEVIIIERSMYDAKHNQGGHALYEIVRGDESLDKALAGIPDEAVRARLEALRDDPVALRAAAQEEMAALYEATMPLMGDEFRQVAGSVLRLAPKTASTVSNSAAVYSSLRGSARSSLAEISPQVPSSSSMNALPSSRSTAGYLPSSEKNRIGQTSDESVDAAPKIFNTETVQAGEQALIPGVEPVTNAQRAQLQADRPLRGGDAPMNVGLFDTDARAQIDLLDTIPIGTRIDSATGELMPELTSQRAILEEIRQDEAMIERFKECVA
jgi:hypothetical protein